MVPKLSLGSLCVVYVGNCSIIYKKFLHTKIKMLALPTVTIKFQKWERGVPKKTRLYDIPLRNYPSQRGDTFRSLQVFKCWVCNALTNKVVMGGYPGYGVRAICPNSSEYIKRLHEKDVKKRSGGKSRYEFTASGNKHALFQTGQ